MKQSRQENLIYLAAWSLLFAAPLLSLYVRTVSEPDLAFDWTEVVFVWRKFVPFLLLFLVHNFLLAPMLVYGQKRVTYFSLIAVVIAVFTIYQCTSRPERPHFKESPERMMRPQRPPALKTSDPPRRPPHKLHRNTPPPIIGEHDILAVVLLILMFGANLGTKYYFHSRDDRRRLAELEKKNLQQQLEYLRYQINPHFFMNTLNNIHALVDIDPAKAQETILELSKMMRFVLYEGNKQGVPLTREFEFIRTYVHLMRLRYTDKVKINVCLPTESPDKTIPPLMLISFIENAFKHGISYQHESFIDIKVDIEQNQQLRFTCRNSKAEKPNQEGPRVADGTSGTKGGVGLQNVRQRLNLIYENNYTLTIQDEADIYNVELTIPL